MLRLGWTAGTSRSYAIPPSRALRLAATPWPPSPDSREPAMGKTEGEKLYQWQLCHHHHSTHVQTLFCTAATDSPRSNTPSGVDSTQLCHVISYRQPSTCCACTTCRIFRASQPSCTHNQQPTTRQQHDAERQKGPEEGGGRGLPVRVGGRRGLRSATLQRSQPDQTHPSSAINSSIRRQRVIF
eukprot:COSAG04_NODE_2009_length_5010_cov_3.534514_5_plen_184_part_00